MKLRLRQFFHGGMFAVIAVLTAAPVAGKDAAAGADDPKRIHAELKYNFAGRTIKLKPEIDATPGTSYYFSDKSPYCAGIFAIHIPAAIKRGQLLPLVVSSHGLGDNGIVEIGMWAGQAERYGFIAVAPSFGSATGATAIGVDDKMLGQILDRVFAKLPVDRKFVLGTGFSGGGLVAYGIMMKYPQWFTALCFRGPNFRGLGARGPWRERPIYIFWGEKDHPMILNPDGPNGLAALLKMKSLSQEYDRRKDPAHFVAAAGKFQWDLVPGGGHDPRADLAAKWFASLFPNATPQPAEDEAEPETANEDNPEVDARPPWMKK